MKKRLVFGCFGFLLVVVGFVLLLISQPSQVDGQLIYIVIGVPRALFMIKDLAVIVGLAIVGSIIFFIAVIPGKLKLLVAFIMLCAYMGAMLYRASNGSVMLVQYFKFNTLGDAICLILLCVFIGSFINFIYSQQSIYLVVLPLIGFLVFYSNGFAFLEGPSGAELNSPFQVITFIILFPSLAVAVFGFIFLSISAFKLLVFDLYHLKIFRIIKLDQPLLSSLATVMISINLFVLILLGSIYLHEHKNLQILNRFVISNGSKSPISTIKKDNLEIVNNIKLVQTYSSLCRTIEPGRFWIVFKIQNQNSDYSVRFKGYIELSSNGKKVGLVALPSLDLPAAQSILVSNENIINQAQTIGVEGGTFASTKLIVEEFEIIKNPESTSLFHGEVINHIVANPTPKHTVNIRIINENPIAIYHTKILAILLSKNGELVDILWSEKPGSWPVGKKMLSMESENFYLESISKTGACLGTPTGNGYEVIFSISAMDALGYPHVNLQSVEIP